MKLSIQATAALGLCHTYNHIYIYNTHLDARVENAEIEIFRTELLVFRSFWLQQQRKKNPRRYEVAQSDNP